MLLSGVETEKSTEGGRKETSLIGVRGEKTRDSIPVACLWVTLGKGHIAGWSKGKGRPNS